MDSLLTLSSTEGSRFRDDSEDEINTMKQQVARPLSEGSWSLSLDKKLATTLMQRHIRNNLESNLQHIDVLESNTRIGRQYLVSLKVE